MGGQHLSLQDVKSNAYVVGAVNDHIVPWQASYKATRLLGGNVRYVLSNGGHVAGIVNPPGPKARHEVAGKNRLTAAEWRASAESRSGSWWEGLDQMGREAGRCPDGAASPGQPPPLGARRGPRRLHPRLRHAPAGSTQPVLDKSTKVRSITSRSQT